LADEALLDITSDPAGRRRRWRRRLLRIAVPLVAVAAIAGAILGIAFHAHEENRRGALGLSTDLLRTLEARVAEEVNAFLGPVDRAARIARDIAALPIATATGRVVFERAATAVLNVLPQVALAGAGDAEGNYIFVRRLPQGGSETKVIVNAPGARRVTFERRNTEGRVIDQWEDPADTYDPRTRPWYTGAIAAGGIAWTDVYVFFTARAPGLTVAVPTAWGGPEGAIGLDIDLVALSRFLAGIRIGQSGRAMILDREGRLVAYPDPARVLREQDGRLLPVRLDDLGDPVLARAFDHLRLERNVSRVVEVEGRRHILVANELPDAGQGWRVLITAPESDFTGFVSANNRQVLLMSLGVVGIAALLGLLLAVQGLRADRTAREARERTRAAEAQGRAVARLAATGGLFDRDSAEAPRALAEALVETTGARRASLWRLLAGGQVLRCEDCHERDTGGHLAGIELHRAEMPAFFRRLEAGGPVAAVDAARQADTAELHRHWMQALGSRALLAVPVTDADGLAGAVWLEDAPADAGDAAGLARVAAGLLAVRFADRAGPASEAAPAALSAGAEPARAGVAEGALLPFAGAGLAAEVLPALAVLALRVTDPLALARPGPDGAPLAEALTALLQEAASAHGLAYLRLSGEEAVAAAGFSREEAGPAAAHRLAAAAIDLRERCHALFEAAREPPAFRIGLDLGVAIGGAVGQGPRFFNLWGDAVRTAQHLAASAPEGAIQASGALQSALPRGFLFRPRGSFYLPRVGEMRAFILAGAA